MTTARPGREKLIEQLRADGLTMMFGNPGTVEQGFLDAVDQAPDFRYVLTLQETVAAGIADGYARATGGPAVLQLHTGVGLGNGIGMLYQSMRGHTPLVVLAGEAGVRYEAMDAQMAADLVGMARPVTKYATRVTDPGSVLRVLRRAVKMAMTPPRGPVFVSLPMDVLDALNDEPVIPTSFARTDVPPAPDAAGTAAALLADASRPLILVGDGVSQSGAVPELVALAELWGADVLGVDSSEVNIPASHPLSRGQTGHMFGQASQALVSGADAVLIVGTYLFPEVFPSLTSPFRPGTPIVHASLDPAEIAKNFPVDLGMVADPKHALAAIRGELAARMSPDQARAARERLAARQAGQEPPEAAAEDGSTLGAFCRELRRRTQPDDLIIFDEALTSSPTVTRHLPPDVPGGYFVTRGGSLGVGIPGAVGIKLAHPGRTVVGFTGDGGAMYTYQALWTAARHGIAAKAVICNNGRYRLLDENIRQYWQEQRIRPHSFPSMFDLSRPEISFAGLARSLGADGMRLDKPEQAEEAVSAMLAAPGPYVIDLITAHD